MYTPKVAQPIAGDKLYQVRAREAFPLLVRQARAWTLIYYSDLARELRMPNPRNLNYVLGSIGNALEGLSKTWKAEVPPINCLVINKTPGLPGEGIGKFITKKEKFSKLSLKQQCSLVKDAQQKVFAYQRWEEVTSALGLELQPFDFSEMTKQAANFRASGESDDHKRLKAFVAAQPESVGLSAGIDAGEIEYALPSGDTIDVLFRDGADWIAVEVKSSLSNNADITRGLFQCVKYRAVVEAVQATRALQRNARAILALEGALPSNLVSIKNTLGVEVVEGVVLR